MAKNSFVEKVTFKTTDESINNAESPEVLTIYICMSNYSNTGLLLLKSCLHKIWSNCIKTHSIKLKTQYDINTIEFYWNTKVKFAVLSNLAVVYDFSCSACAANYISKTKRTSSDRTVEHAWIGNTLLAIRCSSLAIETLEQCVKYVHSNNKDTRMALFWSLYW